MYIRQREPAKIVSKEWKLTIVFLRGLNVVSPDGNGRVARLLMNTALIQDGYMLVIIPPILRSQYISLLEKAHSDARAFNEFIAQQELESQKEIMRLLHIRRPDWNKQEPSL